MKRMEWTLGVVVATGVAALFGGSPIGLKAQQGAPAQAQQGPGQPAPNPARGGGGGGGRGDNSGADFGPRPAVRPQSPADEAASFILPPGYRMELVASEPDIVNPNVVEFDGNGRMYVSEIRSYMLDADGSHEHDPISRISRWESTKGDGKYDKHTVFVDHLVLPRMILPLDDGSILTNETDSDDVVKWTDTNGDGVADKREVFYTGVGTGRDGNLEHEQSGFVWGLDNWIYSTYNAFRFRWTPNGILREPTGPNGGQWGLSMDDDGKMWFVDAGGERGPVNFQFPIDTAASPRAAVEDSAVDSAAPRLRLALRPRLPPPPSIPTVRRRSNAISKRCGRLLAWATCRAAWDACACQPERSIISRRPMALRLCVAIECRRTCRATCYLTSRSAV